MKFSEKIKRSVVKSISFRVFIVLADMAIIYLITHQLATTLYIILLSNLSSTIIYFFHERTWNKIEWGKQKINSIEKLPNSEKSQN